MGLSACPLLLLLLRCRGIRPEQIPPPHTRKSRQSRAPFPLRPLQDPRWHPQYPASLRSSQPPQIPRMTKTSRTRAPMATAASPLRRVLSNLLDPLQRGKKAGSRTGVYIKVYLSWPCNDVYYTGKYASKIGRRTVETRRDSKTIGPALAKRTRRYALHPHLLTSSHLIVLIRSFGSRRRQNLYVIHVFPISSTANYYTSSPTNRRPRRPRRQNKRPNVYIINRSCI